jgi:hypothetical protein
MAFTQAGLPGNGKTTSFEFHYDDTLTVGRGKDLVTGVMPFCDDDWLWLQQLFPRALVSPIGGRFYVYVSQATPVANAEWWGFGLLPFTINLYIGEKPLIAGISPSNAARFLLMVEMSEMLMRDSYPVLHNADPWFAQTNEGSKGEALSQVCGLEFLRARLPGTKTTGFATISSAWLDAGPRDDFVSTDVSDAGFNARVGCDTLFLMFLRDQLGYSLKEIIDHGSTGTLADVFENLTGQAAATAFKPSFADLVNPHYPAGDGPYVPKLETVFPVPDLLKVASDSGRTTWGLSSGSRPTVSFWFTKPATVPTTVHLTSSDQGIISVPLTYVMQNGDDSGQFRTSVLPQVAAFTEKTVTVTLAYAGKELTVDFLVVRPEDYLPPLLIEPQADFGCSRAFEEGSALSLVVANANVFGDTSNLSYAWTVKGAAGGALDTPELDIAALPAAGTAVTVSVQVTDTVTGVFGHGKLDIAVLAKLDPVDEAERIVRCQIASTAFIHRFIPPNVPVEAGPLTREHIAEIRHAIEAPRAALNKLSKSLGALDVAQRAQG